MGAIGKAVSGIVGGALGVVTDILGMSPEEPEASEAPDPVKEKARQAKEAALAEDRMRRAMAKSPGSRARSILTGSGGQAQSGSEARNILLGE
jgi:hypothetical protein